MKWLIDTNVVSEIRKGERCHDLVAAWWAGLADEDMFLSALTIGEIRKGIEIVRPRNPAKAGEIEAWLHLLCTAFADRILPIDAAVAQTWGRLCATRPMPAIDTLLAATALAHDLVLATRNVADVAGSGARLFDPFSPLPWVR